VEEGLPPSLHTFHLPENRKHVAGVILAIGETVSEGNVAKPDRSSARQAAAEIARVLREHGHIAYFAGGCVRDQLLGIEPKDWDVATTATPAEIQSLFRRTHGVGQAFGVVLVNVLGHSIEVTTFRAEGVYSDQRHPDSVRYAGPEEDARRRDFTINGLFQDPATGELIDLVGGQEDLRRGIIRAIGDPRARLNEDRLRMLRAVRFAARYGFEIEPVTERAIRENPSTLEGVSRERIGLEVEWMLSHPARARAAGLLQEIGLDAVVLQEEHQTPALLRLGGLRAEATHAQALAAWWLDRRAGAPSTAEPRGWRAALVLSNDVTDRFLAILESHRVLRQDWQGLPMARRKRQAARPAFRPALQLLGGEDPDRAAAIEVEVAKLAATGLAPQPLIDGEVLLGMGLTAGPSFGRVLEEVYDAQLEGRVRTLEEATELARRLAGRS
jgi:poly(A) polymerase